MLQQKGGASFYRPDTRPVHHQNQFLLTVLVGKNEVETSWHDKIVLHSKGRFFNTGNFFHLNIDLWTIKCRLIGSLNKVTLSLFKDFAHPPPGPIPSHIIIVILLFIGSIPQR